MAATATTCVEDDEASRVLSGSDAKYSIRVDSASLHLAASRRK